jgi:hypothetical protein
MFLKIFLKVTKYTKRVHKQNVATSLTLKVMQNFFLILFNKKILCIVNSRFFSQFIFWPCLFPYCHGHQTIYGHFLMIHFCKGHTKLILHLFIYLAFAVVALLISTIFRFYLILTFCLGFLFQNNSMTLII